MNNKLAIGELTKEGTVRYRIMTDKEMKDHKENKKQHLINEISFLILCLLLSLATTYILKSIIGVYCLINKLPFEPVGTYLNLLIPLIMFYFYIKRYIPKIKEKREKKG
jgi:hypothetical protein